MSALVVSVTALSRFFGGIAMALVVLNVFLVCQSAVMNYGFGVPAPVPPEIVAYLMMGVTFLGAPYVFATGGHIAVDLFAGQRHARASRLRRGVSLLLSLLFAGALTAAGVALLLEAVRGGWRGDEAAWLALWIPYLTLPLGGGLLMLQCLAEFAALLSGQTSAGDDAADTTGFPD